MINVLIATKPDDAHSIYTKLALQKKGHGAKLWYTADIPEQQKHSFELKGNDIIWNSSGVEFEVEDEDKFDVVWVRRPRKPMIPSYLHCDDMENAKNENGEFFKTIWRVIAPDAHWINPIDKLTGVGCKLLQLKTAKEVGLNVPDSLFTNNPEKIKKFISACDEGGVIYKPIYPVYWVSDDYLRLTYTKEINHELLPSDAILQATPGIYQKKISKAYELRITYFGENAIAAKLNSQSHPDAKVDWRSVPCFEIGIEEYNLPEDIHKKCIAFMQKMGVVFGCFDFIVTPEGEYYFLEINEQGQFLWIEEVNPKIKMLDAFTNYLIDSVGGDRSRSSEVVSLADFNNDMFKLQQHAIATHKDNGLLI
jgi:glutathione synthase/RimK-type ligase-like ATP-grasp enzyme